MKKIMDFSGANIAPASVARDYHRGWEIAQAEYLRQQKQEHRQRNKQGLPSKPATSS